MSVTASSVPVDDPGFRWGLGVFESIRVQNGVALFHQMHLESLAQAADALSLPMPDQELWRKAPPGEGIWRWFLTPGVQRDFWEPGVSALPATYSLSLSPLSVHSQSWEARYKTLSYLLRHQARAEAETDESVLLNEKGQIASACMANLYWVKQGRLHTPSLDCGCRDGVLRRWLQESWAGDWNEGAFHPEELGNADEIFITNSRIGVMPVREYQKKALTTGPVILDLQKQYEETVRRQII
jgi:4-amino-4-deoxychorismate lyase